MSCLLCALFWPALICYFGTFAKDRIENAADVAYDTNWYEYPEEARKHIILIIARAQEPIFFMGHGVVRATLEVFGKVWLIYCCNHFFLSCFRRWLFNSIRMIESIYFPFHCSCFDHLAHTT